MSRDSIERGLDREMRILAQQLENGQISLVEYAAAVRELERDARQMEHDERAERANDGYHW